jgi:tetratricopeptide (TPR) repeat protein
MAMRLRRFTVFLLCVGCLLAPRPAGAIPAPEARTRSFKLQSEGMRLYREGKYREATEAFEQVVNINLNSFLAYYYLGICLNAERRYGEAIEPLKIALDLQPDYVQAHLALGNAYLKQGDSSEARAEFLRALELQQNYAPAYDGLGRLFESTGQDREAEEQYRKALEINIAYADSYTHLGDLYMRTGRQDDAIDLFLKAIAVKPDFSSAYTRLGLAYAREERYDDAIAAARKSQMLAPQDPEAYVALARIDLDLESERRAEEQIQAALAQDHDSAAAHLLLSDLKRAQGDFDSAIEVLQELYERGIEDAQMRRAVAEALKKVRADAVRALALKEAVAAAPGSPVPLAELARFTAEQGSHRRAADLLRQAADLAAAGAAPGEPSAASLRYEAGLQELAGRLNARASETFAALAEGGEDLPVELRDDALFNLGVARARLGLDEAAVDSFSAYLARHPDSAPALLYLGNACYRLGRTAQARSHYDAYLRSGARGPEQVRVEHLLKSLPAGSAGGAAAAGGRAGAETP